jgi:hypothetical protein
MGISQGIVRANTKPQLLHTTETQNNLRVLGFINV